MNTHNHVDKFVDEFLDLKNVILLITTLPNFLKYNPPCKECLIQGMCIIEKTDIEHYLTIKVCDKLRTFLIDNIDNKEIDIKADELIKLEGIKI